MNAADAGAELSDEQCADVWRYDPDLLNADESFNAAKFHLRHYRQHSLWEMD